MYIRPINNSAIVIFLLCINILIAGTKITDSDIQILKNDVNSLVFEWQPQDIKLEPQIIESKKFTSVSFLNGVSVSEIGAADIPWRVITLGIPEKGIKSVQILNIESTSYSEISIAPIPRPYKDNKNLTNYAYDVDEQKYENSTIQSQKIYRLKNPDKFRDFNIQLLMLTPFSYNNDNHTLTLHSKIKVQVIYEKSFISSVYEQRGKLDRYNEDFILNYDIAKNWQTPQRTLKKGSRVTSIPSGDVYRIPISEDGLYKITASTVAEAGISLENLSLNAVQMFNNSGHTLHINVDSEYYNPPYTLEIPIFISDLNDNGFFDGSDYILFYGKSNDSWFYDYNQRRFLYQKHPYATSNYYLLSFSGSNGKRMSIEHLENIPEAIPADFHNKYYHFEEDKYNLLASGPDWYGYRFYGLSDSYSKTINTSSYNPNLGTPYLRVQIKGGSGVEYKDDLNYRYYFTISLNNEILFNRSSFTEHSIKTYQRDLPDPSLLLSGQNILNLQYEGNLEGCAAHLNWIELIYPSGFSTENNHLNFYTRDTESRRYTLSNLTGGGIYVFDVTNPIEPLILVNSADSQNGQISFNIPSGGHLRNLIVTSLNSSKINTISTLESYQSHQDLLSTNNQADFVIITHKTFIPYAEEIAQLRDHLTTKVVSTDDIYYNFNSSTPDPTAIRNFIRYAYNNWQGDRLSYVLLFGDGHYDYRNIVLENDTLRVPPFEIYNATEIDSRTTDNFYVDLHYSGSSSFNSISPDIAIGRLPMESVMDAERMVEKLQNYQNQPDQNGWQATLTLVADDQKTTSTSSEWQHQSQTESLANLNVLNKFLIKKVYLSAYESIPGGFGEIKIKANRELIDRINQGSLIVNYVGHGSPRQWAHESVFNMSRDLPRINNPGRLTFFVAATCDFGKYDDPVETSFSEALIWKKNAGAIGVLASVRLVYSGQNAEFNERFYRYLFPGGQESIPLGIAKLHATLSNVNDQKYHLFADPSMMLADPRSEIRITSIAPSDTLKALSEVEVNAEILDGINVNTNFNGGAVLIINDARYDSINTGGSIYYTLPGPTLFKGEVTVSDGLLNGKFIVPKSIRFEKKNTGRITLFAWDDNNLSSGLGYDKTLLFLGSTNIENSDGPDIDIYFEDRENFSDGDLIQSQPVLIATIQDENGINMTGETGHIISLQIDDENPEDVSGYFFYEKDSYTNGYIRYPMDKLVTGQHSLKLSAFDNVNNLSEESINFKVAASEGLILMNVVNYPNPFRARSENTMFTFEYQTQNNNDAEVKIKLYTVSGRLIQTIDGYYVSGAGYEEIEWDGKDRDGDHIANGVYLYKLILDDGTEKKEIIEKLVILN